MSDKTTTLQREQARKQSAARLKARRAARDVQTLWSPDATVTVTDHVDYCDIGDWAVSMYRDAVRATKERNRQYERDYGPDYMEWNTLNTFATWLALPRSKNCNDLFGATFLRLHPLILIAEIAVRLETDCGVDGTVAIKELVDAYRLWCSELDEAIRAQHQIPKETTS
jgi:hypothetical protein